MQCMSTLERKHAVIRNYPGGSDRDPRGRIVYVTATHSLR